jgi:hypothetical protein
MDRYKKYIVKFEIGGKVFRGKVTAFNEDNARKQVRDKIKFLSIEEYEEEKLMDENIVDFFNAIFGKP